MDKYGYRTMSSGQWQIFERGTLVHVGYAADEQSAARIEDFLNNLDAEVVSAKSLCNTAIREHLALQREVNGLFPPQSEPDTVSGVMEKVYNRGYYDGGKEARQGVSLDAFQAEVGAWGIETFKDSTEESILAHFAEEAIELVGLDIMREVLRQKSQVSLSPKSIGLNKPDYDELPDAPLLLLHLAHRRGVYLMDLMQAKMQVNRERVWADSDGRGYAKHVETEQGQEAKNSEN